MIPNHPNAEGVINIDSMHDTLVMEIDDKFNYILKYFQIYLSKDIMTFKNMQVLGTDSLSNK